MARQAPYWPALMKRDLARLYTDMSAAEFERAVDAGHLPGPVFGDRYSRAEIDAYLERLVGDEPDWRKGCKLFQGRDAA